MRQTIRAVRMAFWLPLAVLQATRDWISRKVTLAAMCWRGGDSLREILASVRGAELAMGATWINDLANNLVAADGANSLPPAVRTASAQGTGVDLVDADGSCFAVLHVGAVSGTTPTLDVAMEKILEAQRPLLADAQSKLASAS